MWIRWTRIRIRIRIRNTDFYIDLSRYGGNEVQQKQVNRVCEVTKARYFDNFASTKKYVTRGRGFDQFFSVRNAVNSKQIILTVFNTKQKSLFAYKYLQISLLLRKEVHTFLLSTDLLLPQTLDILLVMYT